MKNLLLFLVFLFSIHSIYGQASLKGKVTDEVTGEDLIAATVILKKSGSVITGTNTDFDGNFLFSNIDSGSYDVEISYIGYQTQRMTGVMVSLNEEKRLDVSLGESGIKLEEIVVKEYRIPLIEQDNTSTGGHRISNSIARLNGTIAGSKNSTAYYIGGKRIVGYKNQHLQEGNTENYAAIVENHFKSVYNNPLSTFSIDVDGASYANTRRFLNQGSLPQVGAVRIEEFINYFKYDYEEPQNHPIHVQQELGPCPWKEGHYLLKIGMQGKRLDKTSLPPSNIVFLIDVSGSMSSANKLDLLKEGIELLVDNLREEDRISIVVYAGAAGLVLPATSGDDKATILNAIHNLSAGGSTAGGQGLKLAYKVAEENFLDSGNNRILLATDGDFNIGVSSNSEMKKLVESRRSKGIDISVLGFGYGNLKDDRLEIIAQYGNGNYNYIDNIKEAKKVLVDQFGGTFYTIAKDVKLQIEFNPDKVASYRLIGYENRLLNEEDFKNDKIDAGEIGLGHSVTALYEIVPAGKSSKTTKEPLKYQSNKRSFQLFDKYKKEWLTTKIRYKMPDSNKSIPISFPLKNGAQSWDNCSNDFKFISAVAGFGMLLRESEFKGDTDYSLVKDWAQEGLGEDRLGYRKEFLDLVDKAASFSESIGMQE